MRCCTAAFADNFVETFPLAVDLGELLTNPESDGHALSPNVSLSFLVPSSHNPAVAPANWQQLLLLSLLNLILLRSSVASSHIAESIVSDRSRASNCPGQSTIAATVGLWQILLPHSWLCTAIALHSAPQQTPPPR